VEASGLQFEASPGKGNCEILSQKEIKQKVWGYSSSGRVLAEYAQGFEFNHIHSTDTHKKKQGHPP
jgi:hypothetical protein